MRSMKRILAVVLTLILIAGCFTAFAAPTVPDFSFDTDTSDDQGMSGSVFTQYLNGYLNRLNITSDEYEDAFTTFLVSKDMDREDYEAYLEGYFEELGFDTLLFNEKKLDEFFAQKPYLPQLDEYAYEYITGMPKPVETDDDGFDGSDVDYSYEDTSNAGMTLYTTGGVNVRQGPGTEYDKITTLSAATKLTLIKEGRSEQNTPWYYCSYGSKGGKGWISGSYISETKPVVTKAPSSANGTITMTGDSNLRDEPYIGADILGVVKKGTVLEYSKTAYEDRDGEEVKWYKVKYDGDTGWVSEKYTKKGGSKKDDGGKVIHEKGKKYQYYLEATSSTNIRKEGNLDAKVITSISKGERAPYLGDKKKDSRGVWWYKVETHEGKTGWISEKYTKMRKGTLEW